MRQALVELIECLVPFFILRVTWSLLATVFKGIAVAVNLVTQRFEFFVVSSVHDSFLLLGTEQRIAWVKPRKLGNSFICTGR